MTGKYRNEPDCYLGEDVDEGTPPRVLARQEDGFVSKGREGRVPAKKPSHEKEASLGCEDTGPLGNPGDHADRQASAHIHHERSIRESRGATRLQHHSTEQISCNGTEESSTTDQQNVAHDRSGYGDSETLNA